MTALKAQHFGRTADISVILVKLLQNVVALVRRACLVQRGELISNGAPTAIAVYQRRQVLTLKAAGRRIHNDDALDHVAEFAHISRPGVAHKGLNSVITDLARPAAIGGREIPKKTTSEQKSNQQARAEQGKRAGSPVKAGTPNLLDRST